MSFLRFNHVFIGLMLLCILSAFILPARVTDAGKAQLEGIFTPVSRPSRRIARFFYARLAPRDDKDPPAKEDVKLENDDLRQEVVRLRTDLDRLEKLEAERQQLGDLKALCKHYPVTGSDSGTRDTLVLNASTLSGLKPGSPVLYDGGLAGRIEDGGVAAARVRLITDLGSHCTGAFIRFVNNNGKLQATKVPAPTPFVEGLGQSQLVIRSPLSMRDVKDAGVLVGDWVVLSDNAWPTAVQGVRLGRIVSIAPQSDHPLFAEIRVAPESALTRLADVWVLTGSSNPVPSAPAATDKNATVRTD